MAKFVVATAAILTFALFGLSAQAQNLTLQQIDEEDFKKIVSDFSAVFHHSSVSGASSLGTIFGFEVGLMGGVTDTSRIDKLADEGGEQKADKIPHASLLGIITVPAGITVEGGFIPKVGSEDFKFSTFTLGVKWTPTDVFLDWPLSVAIKGQITKTKAEFTQEIGTTPPIETKFNYDNSITAVSLLVSKNFVLVEPYAGFTLMNAKGEMGITGSPNVFDPAYTSGDKVSASVASSGFMVGAELKLFVVKLGAEYQNLFGTSRYSGKLSFYF